MVTPDQDPLASLIVPIKLQNYWHETITKQEGVRRLKARNLDSQTFERLRKEIPPKTEHYLTFHGGAFREFVDFGDRVAQLVLLLPVEHKDKTFVVSLPVDRERFPDGRVRDIRGMGFSEFTAKDGRLLENGTARDSFGFSKGPMEITLDVSFVAPRLTKHPKSGRCCRACEWVHSKLDIHGADRFCCLGLCD